MSRRHPSTVPGSAKDQQHPTLALWKATVSECHLLSKKNSPVQQRSLADTPSPAIQHCGAQRAQHHLRCSFDQRLFKVDLIRRKQ